MQFGTLPSVAPGRMLARCDGACEPNPGAASFGVVMFDHEREVDVLGHCLGHGTNNVAELEAVAHALRWGLERGLALDVRTDSVLAVAWARGAWRVKMPTYVAPVSAVRRLVALTGSTVTWEPRVTNWRADQVAEDVRGADIRRCAYCADYQRVAVQASMLA